MNKITLIVGLGNPNYENTYHNVGADILYAWLNMHINNVTKIKQNLYKININNNIIYVLLCPSMMNVSGEKTRQIYDYYKCNNMIVVVDDLDTKDIKLHNTTYAKGHNGIRSINLHFNNILYKRILIGINRPTNILISSYVLQKRSNEYNENLLLITLPKLNELIQLNT